MAPPLSACLIIMSSSMVRSWSAVLSSLVRLDAFLLIPGSVSILCSVYDVNASISSLMFGGGSQPDGCVGRIGVLDCCVEFWKKCLSRILRLKSRVSLIVWMWFGGAGVGTKDSPLIRTDRWCSLSSFLERLQIAVLSVALHGWYFLYLRFFLFVVLLESDFGSVPVWPGGVRCVSGWWCCMSPSDIFWWF